MRQLTLVVLAAVFAAVVAEGQYYVPRAYYTIDTDGHASLPVPLRRLRRSILPPSYYPGASATANANANANARANGWGGGNANAEANANANANAGDYLPSAGSLPPVGSYGSANPAYLKPGMTIGQSGPIGGAHSVTASSSVGLDSTGRGYYENRAGVSN